MNFDDIAEALKSNEEVNSKTFTASIDASLKSWLESKAIKIPTGRKTKDGKLITRKESPGATISRLLVLLRQADEGSGRPIESLTKK